MLRLSPRLSAIAELVPPQSKIADIGADHGYLSIYLAMHKQPESVIAADIRQAPLASAAQHVHEAGLTDKISLRLCDGLEGIKPDEADVIIIAGMGGETIQGILARAPWALQENRLLILEPQSKQEELRRWLYAQNCGIRSEHLVRDAGRIYPILCAGGSVCREPDFADFKLGHWPPETRDDLFFAYLDAQILKIDRAIAGLENSQIQENLERLAQLRILRSQLMTLESRK